MKEIYEWVPWCQELSRTIADNGRDFLIERAKRVSGEELRTLPYDAGTGLSIHWRNAPP